MKKKRILIIFLCAFLIIVAVTFAATVLNGTIMLNNPSEEEYPIRGVDVSEYQGEIDWQVLSAQDIDFAFIKATEGSSYVDSRFEYNIENARKTDLKIGFYHFFSYDSSGKTQAENFINTVPKIEEALPPVADVEFYGDKAKDPPDKESVQKELNDFLSTLEAHYGKKPIIYATMKSYRLYLENDYDDYDIWIRDVFRSPSLGDNREWTFWQYTDREILDGYNGEEHFIDMNVFNGDETAWAEYCR